MDQISEGVEERRSDDDQYDDADQSCMDIDEFERRLKNQRGARSDDSDDDIPRRPQPAKPPVAAAKKIEELQRQIQQSKQPRDEIEETIASKNESLKDKKIRELASRNKTLQVQLQSERVARGKVEAQLAKVAKETDDRLQQLDESKKVRPSSAASRQTQDPLLRSLKVPNGQPPKKEEASYEELKQKWKDADKKVQEQRIVVQNLKSELNKAMRLLQRETGNDNINLDQMLGEENAWKGRAQQIELLKGKLLSLQQRVSNTSQYSNVSSETTKSDTKRVQMDQMKQQIESLRQENELLQSKVKAVSSRKQTLESEIKDIRAEYEKNKKVLLEKSDNDTKYLQALKNELTTLRKNPNPVETKIIYKTRDVEPVEKARPDDQRLKIEIQHLREELKRNEAMVQELINEKLRYSQSSQSIDDQGPQVKKLEDEVRILRRERDEFFKTLTRDQDTQKMIKDLTQQNVKLRSKLDEMRHN